MTIRLKLFLFYVIFFASIITMAAVSYWAIARWRRSASDLVTMHEKNLIAEKLRAMMTQQVNLGIDYLNGEEIADSDFVRVEERIADILAKLKGATGTSLERDHIEGLEQTHDELSWVINGFLKTGRDLQMKIDANAARRRLREIADEVSDDISALNQYYRSEVEDSVTMAKHAGTYASLVIIATVLIALSQLIALVILIRRWLMKPFADVKRATAAISIGKLATRIEIVSGDEWGQLAQAVNHMAKSLENSQQRLAAQERLAAIGELGAYTAHNIRNPLAGIRAAVQVINDDLPESFSVSKESIVEVIQAVDRLDAWVKGFLNFARPLELSRSMSDVNELVITALEIVQGKFMRRRIRVETSLDESLPNLKLDQILMEQAIAAIISNAFESEADLLTIMTSRLDSGDGDENVVVSVGDNGKGISEAMRGRIFNAFTTDKSGGTGLGLAQAKKIVDLHGGNIAVQSAVGRGTTMQIHLPINTESADDTTVNTI